jgi:hypothetical protein
MATAFDPGGTLWDEWFNLEVGWKRVLRLLEDKGGQRAQPNLAAEFIAISQLSKNYLKSGNSPISTGQE